MKTTLLFLSVFLSVALFGQNVYIPDANFKAFLVGNSAINTNNDNEIQVSEANSYDDAIYLSSLFNQNISDLTGIEAFTALTFLYCEDNQLTSLDVSQNTALMFLFLACPITSLDVSQNTALQSLNCASNQLTSLDVSQNTALTSLDCASNQLTSLDVSQNTALEYLACGGNELISLDVSQNTALTNLDCLGNQLTSLDLSQNAALQNLNCKLNQLTSLDVSQNAALQSLNCSHNQLTCLNVANGNNVNFVFQLGWGFNPYNNPQLYCIDVDDAEYSAASIAWNAFMDPQTAFSEYCGNDCSNCIPTSVIDIQEACDSYTWIDGNIYTEPNDSATYTMVDNNGCESTVTLNLTINNPTYSNLVINSCGQFTSASGQIINDPGFYLDTIPNTNGCDSIISYNLTINTSSSNTITETVCGSYLLNGQTYNSSGTYTQTLTNVAGCDSIITLELTINPNDFDITFESSQQLFTSPPFAVAFSNTSPDLLNYTYTWYWGDGTSTTSNNATVFHEYLNNGLYTVTLEATNNSTGCADQTTFTDYIYTTGGVSCTHSATIIQSGPIDACEGQTVILSCNSDPNYSYQWRRNGIYISGNNNDSLLVTSSGSYAVIITENNCPVSSSEIIVSFTTGIPTPTIVATGSIQPCVGGSVTLDAGSGYDNYLWSTGGTSQTEVVSASGDYTVTVSDLSGCSLTSSVYTVNASFMQPQQVCIVGVDSLSNYNRIVWEKPISDGIDYFNVYKEGNAADVYDFIGSVSYEDTAIFVDENSNTAVQAYRYKVSIVDTCSTESALGEFHKTIHLTINQGVGQTWNLIWNHYEGFGFPSYNIYRGTDPSNMYLLETIASNLNSYTDINPPSGSTIYYQIEVVNTNGCDPLKATDYGVSKSNIATTSVVDVIDFYNNSLSIYPNPTEGIISIESQKPIFNEFIIQDNQGRTVYEGLLKGEKTKLNLNDLSNGAYYLQIKNMVKRKIVVVH